MNLLPSSNALLMVQTQSGSQYQFREYAKGKWEMLREATYLPDRFPEGKWVKIALLPVILEGQPMRIWISGKEVITTTKVTFIGRNN